MIIDTIGEWPAPEKPRRPKVIRSIAVTCAVLAALGSGIVLGLFVSGSPCH